MIRSGHAAACAVVLAGIYACTYAWPIGTSSPDAGDDGSKPEDGSTDGFDGDAGDATDGPSLDDVRLDVRNVDCGALKARAASTRATAKKCTFFSTECGGSVKDECDCPTWVDFQFVQPTYEYADAAFILRNSGCQLQCPSQCPSIGGPLCKLIEAGTGLCQPP